MPRVHVKDRRRQQLIDANIASIAKRGYAETTITHISEGAGMSRGIINFYFTTKEAMMRDTLKYLVEDYTGYWHAALEKQKNASAEEKLQALIDANFDKAVCSNKRLAVWSAFWGHASSHKEYSKLIQTADELHLNKIAELWDAICEKTSGKKRSQSTFPQVLHGLIRGMWLMMQVSPEVNDASTQVKVCQRALQEAIDMLRGNATPVTVLAKPKAVKEKKVVPMDTAKPKKKKEMPLSDRQLDFADLFGR